MTELERQNKNKNIAASMKETMLRRQNQICRVYTVKVDKSRLTKQQKEQFKMLFIEGKWIWNNLVAYYNDNKTVNGFNLNQMMKVKLQDGTFEDKNLEYIGSQMKQSILKQFNANVKTCNRLVKQKKQKHYTFKFKNEIKSIDLKQYGTTYSFYGNGKMKMQNIKGSFKVNGTKQFKNIKGLEFANAKILNTPKGYYIAITTYIDRNKIQNINYNDKRIGIDFGSQTSFTTSEGEKINVFVQESGRIKKLSRKMHRRVKGSKGRAKVRHLLKIEYQKLSNKKNDLSNKIVSKFSKNNLVVMQDEQIDKWKIKHGKKVQHSVLGRVKSKLKTKANVVMINKYYPTTKLCTKCGNYHDKMTEKDRTFICPICGHTEDRDIHAANNMLWLYDNIIGLGRTEVTRKEIEPLIVSIINGNGQV